MKRELMTQQAKDVVNTIYKNLQEKMSDVLYRWQDEQKYEDWNEYINYFKDILNKENPKAVFIKASKRPFGFTFDFDGYIISISASMTKYSWKRI
jgi:Zn-dependent M32 family carboxypeptidase